MNDTVKLAVQPSQEVKRKTVQYETGFTLPPGQYRLKVVLRENQSGAIGSYERDLIEVFHRPENRVLHDRIGERALARLSPAMAAIIADGIELGQFRRQDPRRAAAYVMACFGSLHEVVSDPDDMTSAIDELNLFVLGALGYDGEVPK